MARYAVWTLGAIFARLAPPRHSDTAKRPRGPFSANREGTMRITAAVLYDVNKPYSIEPVELDPPKRGEVLVKVGAAGICRSDLHFQKGEATIALPAVLGHEGSGTVETVGEGVSMVEARRSRHPELRAQLRALPLVRDRPAAPLRRARAHQRQALRRHLAPAHSRRSGSHPHGQGGVLRRVRGGARGRLHPGARRPRLRADGADRLQRHHRRRRCGLQCAVSGPATAWR